MGIAQGALDKALKYSMERKQFGQTLSSFQAIQFKLADMATQTELSRLMILRAASLKDAHLIPLLFNDWFMSKVPFYKSTAENVNVGGSKNNVKF